MYELNYPYFHYIKFLLYYISNNMTPNERLIWENEEQILIEYNVSLFVTYDKFGHLRKFIQFIRVQLIERNDNEN